MNTWQDGKLGDEVLVQVTAVLEYGLSQPALFGGIPIGGYNVTVVADAVLLVGCFEF